MDSVYNSCLYVDLDSLRSNFRSILSRLHGATLIPVLKSDAFGLGLVPVGQTACEFPEIKCLAAAHVSEGLELREAGIDGDILIIGSAFPAQLSSAVAAGLTLTVGRLGFLPELDRVAAELGTSAKVHIKLDTGLHRIGLEVGDELDALIRQLKDCSHIHVTGTFSHFADGFDQERCQAQYQLYMQGLRQLEERGIEFGLRHISCSASSELYPRYELDAVRVGRGLFMDNPVKPQGNLKETASWRSAVAMIKQRRNGDSLGYGKGVTLTKDALVASIGVGYGDGLFPALAAAGAPVLINGSRCPLLYCSMDQSLVDVSGVNCAVGDQVTLFGYSSGGDYLSSQELAAMIGASEGCALTSALSKRVNRVYLH